MNNNHTVVVLGASHKPERYSNRAVRMLKERNYHIIPIHPKLDMIEDIPVCHALDGENCGTETRAGYFQPRNRNSRAAAPSR
jgi:hypothetical protein